MKQFEYKVDCVPPYRYQEGREIENPQRDILKCRGMEGWELCVIGPPDCSGTRSFFFKRELLPL